MSYIWGLDMFHVRKYAYGMNKVRDLIRLSFVVLFGIGVWCWVHGEPWASSHAACYPNGRECPKTAMVLQ